MEQAYQDQKERGWHEQEAAARWLGTSFEAGREKRLTTLKRGTER